MLYRSLRILRTGAILLLVILATFLAVRIYDTQRSPPLRPWHTYVPDELGIEELDRADWTDYLKSEGSVFAAVRGEVTERLAPEGVSMQIVSS
jgi:hypothetical protein